MTTLARRTSHQIATWKIAATTVLAGAALVGAVVHASAFENAGRHGTGGYHSQEQAPFGANAMGRGIAGQLDRFQTNAGPRAPSTDEAPHLMRGSLRLR